MTEENSVLDPEQVVHSHDPSSEMVEPPSALQSGKTLRPRERRSISSFTILIIILFIVALLSFVCSLFLPDVSSASIPEVFDSSVAGLIDAAEISFFLLIIGGALGIVTKTGALRAGIATLVKRMKGRELLLIPVIMGIFAILGSAYGFCEESVPFYGLLALTMVAAGFDTMVASAMVLLGAGVGCLGSTVNPFANGVAIASLRSSGIEVDPGTTIMLGILLLITSYSIAVFFVIRYAKRVRDKKGSILNDREKTDMKRFFGPSSNHVDAEECLVAEGVHEGSGSGGLEETGPAGLQLADDREQNVDREVAALAHPSMSRSQALTLALFGFSFLVMIVGFIPWENFGVTIFVAGGVPGADGGWDVLPWSAYITGLPLGEWYFRDASVWFLIMSVVMGIAARLDESQIVDSWISGASEMVGVALVVGLARAIALLMGSTNLDMAILDSASGFLADTNAFIFAPLSYLVFLGLAFIITSTSALATLSMPIMGGLADQLGFSPDVMVMLFVAASGLANLFSPTAAFLPGLVMAHVEYPTWLRWAAVPIVIIGLASVALLTGAMLVL